jgi:hypothetical protein
MSFNNRRETNFMVDGQSSDFFKANLTYTKTDNLIVSHRIVSKSMISFASRNK